MANTGEKWQKLEKVVKSGKKWGKVGKSGGKVGINELGKVGKIGEKWGKAAILDSDVLQIRYSFSTLGHQWLCQL